MSAPVIARLAARMSRVSASATMQVIVEADKLRQQGIDVVEFGAGEPDFPTPAHIKATPTSRSTRRPQARSSSSGRFAIATRPTTVSRTRLRR
jgi:aspartate/methionine/tyrosine aminotransferase